MKTPAFIVADASRVRLRAAEIACHAFGLFALLAWTAFAVVAPREPSAARAANALGASVVLALAVVALLGCYALRRRAHWRAQAQWSEALAALGRHVGLLLTDARGRFVDANQAFLEMTGYTRRELRDRAHVLLRVGCYAGAQYRAIHAATVGGQIWHGELRNRRRDGTHFWSELTVIPFADDGGHCLRRLSIHTDITQRKALEARLRLHEQRMRGLADAIGHAVVALDMDGRCTFMNRSAEQMLGWCASELIGHSLHQAIDADYLDHGVPDRECAVLRELCAGRAVDSSDKIFVDRSGARIPVAVSGRPLHEGEVQIGAVITFKDIAPDKAREAELERAKAAAEEASRAKSLFLANMSHEIRTPMNAVIGLTELCLREDLAEDTRRDYLAKIRDAGRTLLTVVNEILDFSKIGTDRLALEQIEFEIDQVLGNALALVEHRTTAKGIALGLQLRSAMDARFRGDPVRLRQVLTNLLDNAVKFTDQGNITITVGIGRTERRRAELLFSVADTGIGMDAEQQRRVFDPFAQADTSTTRRFGGTGLGLSIVKSLIERMGGMIRVVSQPGTGTTFYFNVWLTRVGAGADEDAPAPIGRAVVADPVPATRLALAEALAPLAREVIQMNDGRNVVALARRAAHERRPIELVLANASLPGIDAGRLRALLAQAGPQGRAPLVVLAVPPGADVGPDALDAPRVCMPVTTAMLGALLAGHAAPAAAPAAPHDAAQPPGPARLDGLRVLVVDDDDVNRLVAQATLEALGVQVDVATDGTHALERLFGAPPDHWDLVLMDVHMPGLDGYEATRALRRDARFRGLPVLAITADVLPEAYEACTRAGMNDRVTKPFQIEELGAALALWSGKHGTAGPVRA